MNIKKRVLLILLFVVCVIFSSGITYSVFTSGAALEIANQKIAKFIFNTEKLDHLELSLVDMNPGSTDEYDFSVNNTSETALSNITVNYQIIVKTFHLIPLEIKLYKVGDDDTETLLMSCDESYSRNSENELVCNSEVEEMPYTKEAIENYKLKVSFPSKYSEEQYSNLVDYIDLEIKSWQKIDD